MEQKIIKKKKKYCKPELHIEEFTPSEYIAACWGVACVGATANKWEQDNRNYHNGNVNHNGSCTSVSNQFLVDDDNNGVPEGMYELSSEQGRMDCTIYTDDKYRTTKAVSTVSIGDYIYWTTHNDNYTWHHQGKVVSLDGKSFTHS